MSPITEAQFQEQVIDLAHLNGWLAAHFRAAKTDKGYRTPVQADGAGFPDLVLVRRGELIFAELKSDTGRPTDEQIVWLAAIADAEQEAYLWAPRDWPEVEARLGRRS